MNYIWKKKTGQYQTGCNLYLNRIHLGGYEWNSMRSQGTDEPTDWAGHINLPSLMKSTVYGITIEEIKAKMEKLVTEWFNEILRD